MPQKYLENFEDQKRTGFIWVHDKRGGPARSAAISKVAQIKGFYSAETEVILARHVETPGNAVIRTLTTSERAITPAERLQLAYYIGVMMKRIPASRRRSTAMMPDVLADVVARVREQLTLLAYAAQADPALLAQRLREVDAAERKFAVDPPAEVMERIREPWPSQDMLRALFGMTWRVLISGGPQYFATTDNPAFFFRAYGLAGEAAELTFPLSTSHALHGSWQTAQSDLLFLKARQPMVREINRRLASGADRIGFYHENAPWLLTILPKKYPYLSAIRWLGEPPSDRRRP